MESTNSPRVGDNRGMTEPPHQRQGQAAGRFIAGVFGVAFAGIGLSVIGFLWFGDDGFGSPPVIFKLVGSLIASVFVAVGGTAAYGAITGRGLTPPPQPDAPTAPSPAAPSSPAGSYTCPHCGGGLDRATEVSPMGDVKCSFCGRWFNVHGRTSA